jgi:DNA-binding NarL/FixJ family response regulator
MRVLIAEDQALLRQGLALLFEDAGHEMVASLPDVERVLPTIESARPDLVVLDVRMPPTFTDEGTRLACSIKADYPDLGVLILSHHVETRHAVELISLGGFGYLLKDRVLDIPDFLDAAERVANGGSALDPQVVLRLVSSATGDDPLAHLSIREHEVLALMAQGRTNAGIANALCVSPGTVEKHVHSILVKLHLPKTDDDHRRVLAVVAYLDALASSRNARTASADYS